MEVQSIHFSVDADLAQLVSKIASLLHTANAERDEAKASKMKLKEVLGAATERACADSNAAACKVDVLEVELSRTRSQYADYKLHAEANARSLHAEISRLLKALEDSRRQNEIDLVVARAVDAARSTLSEQHETAIQAWRNKVEELSEELAALKAGDEEPPTLRDAVPDLGMILESDTADACVGEYQKRRRDAEQTLDRVEYIMLSYKRYDTTPIDTIAQLHRVLGLTKRGIEILKLIGNANIVVDHTHHGGGVHSFVHANQEHEICRLELDRREFRE